MPCFSAEEVAAQVYAKMAHQFADLRVIIGGVEKAIKAGSNVSAPTDQASF